MSQPVIIPQGEDAEVSLYVPISHQAAMDIADWLTLLDVGDPLLNIPFRPTEVTLHLLMFVHRLREAVAADVPPHRREEANHPTHAGAWIGVDEADLGDDDFDHDDDVEGGHN